MQNKSTNPYFPGLRRARQITISHCGPAVLSMLLSHCGSEVGQDVLVEAAEIRHALDDYGMTVDEMARAVRIITPQLQLWYKEGSSVDDIDKIIDIHGYPVGIEWQGVFYEDEDEDNGHYSIITHVDKTNGIVTIADPYSRFAGVDRSFHIEEFEGRWWDENEIFDPTLGYRRAMRDDRMSFIVTPKGEFFPSIFGMVAA